MSIFLRENFEKDLSKDDELGVASV